MDAAAIRAELAMEWLRSITMSTQSGLGLKNIERSLAGDGDLDVSAAPEDWAISLRLANRAFSSVVGGGSFVGIACMHVPNCVLSMWHPGSGTTIYQMDLSSVMVTRGYPWARPRQLSNVAYMDSRGFRAVNPAVQTYMAAVTKASSGATGLARMYVEALRHCVATAPEGEVLSDVRMIFSNEVLSSQAMDLAEAMVRTDEWHPAFARFARTAQLLALANPRFLAERMIFRARPRCSMFDVIARGRSGTSLELARMGRESGHRVLAG